MNNTAHSKLIDYRNIGLQGIFILCDNSVTLHYDNY